MKRVFIVILLLMVIFLSCEAIWNAIIYTSYIEISSPENNSFTTETSTSVSGHTNYSNIESIELSLNGVFYEEYFNPNYDSNYVYEPYDDNGEEILKSSDYDFNFTFNYIPLEMGENTITVSGYDHITDYELTDSVSLYSDGVPPVLSISYPANTAVIEGNSITLTGTANDFSGIGALLYQGPGTRFGDVPSENANWSLVLTDLPYDQALTVTILAWDTRGNQSTRSVSFTCVVPQGIP